MSESNERIEQLTRCLLQVIGRATMPADTVRGFVGVGKQLKAYNLCDGTMTQTEIRKKVGLDAGNFSRTAARWIENGVAFEVGSNNESRILHLYPLPSKTPKKRHKK